MFIKVTDTRNGTSILLNTAAVSSFSGSGKPRTNTLAYIAEPYREDFRANQEGCESPEVIILQESRSEIETLLREAGELA